MRNDCLAPCAVTTGRLNKGAESHSRLNGRLKLAGQNKYGRMCPTLPACPFKFKCSKGKHCEKMQKSRCRPPGRNNRVHYCGGGCGSVGLGRSTKKLERSQAGQRRWRPGTAARLQAAPKRLPKSPLPKRTKRLGVRKASGKLRWQAQDGSGSCERAARGPLTQKRGCNPTDQRFLPLFTLSCGIRRTLQVKLGA